MDAEPAEPSRTGRTVPAAVRVVGVTAERPDEIETVIPWELAGPPGQVAVQLRTTVPRVTVGVGLARRPGLLEAVRGIAGSPGVATSPVGGTFVVGGPGWIGLSALGVAPPAAVWPIDWMLGAVHGWLQGFLRPLGVTLRPGRVEGAWCPGFSDGGVDGRKLVGLGFRVSRGRIACRGVLAVLPLRADDLAWLRACHALIGLPVDPGRCTSLAECTGDAGWDAAAAVTRLARATFTGTAAA
ncbi:MAG TPA: hypothetical protein VNN74_00700 [Candidatus Micrarchaeia archaeon]|nr:hypothetical protein [Candidatus Micrarchaeia archaeon]